MTNLLGFLESDDVSRETLDLDKTKGARGERCLLPGLLMLYQIFGNQEREKISKALFDRLPPKFKKLQDQLARLISEADKLLTEYYLDRENWVIFEEVDIYGEDFESWPDGTTILHDEPIDMCLSEFGTKMLKNKHITEQILSVISEMYVFDKSWSRQYSAVMMMSIYYLCHSPVWGVWGPAGSYSSPENRRTISELYCQCRETNRLKNDIKSGPANPKYFLLSLISGGGKGWSNEYFYHNEYGSSLLELIMLMGDLPEPEYAAPVSWAMDEGYYGDVSESKGELVSISQDTLRKIRRL